MAEAIHRLFNNAAARKISLNLRYVVALALLVVVAFLMKPEWLLPAFLVSMVGELIQCWSFGCLIKNDELAARGPYALTRNPMYLGRFLLILGLVMLFGNPYVILVYCVLYFFYMVNRVEREEAKLRPAFGEPYEEYCRDVNRYWPKLSRLFAKDVRFFSWKRFANNHGHWNFLSVLVIYGALYAFVLFGTSPWR
jgi:protein-S-isoprenylcysteine O-methyltransferase Ste14